MLNFKNVNETSSVIYKIYYLWFCIMNQWNHFLEFIQFFIAVDCNAQNSQILLDKSVLKDFKINICNSIDFWKFKQKLQIIEIFFHKFIKKLSASTAHIFEVWTAYRSCFDNDNKIDFWNDKSTTSDDLTNMSKKLYQKYCDFSTFKMLIN